MTAHAKPIALEGGPAGRFHTVRGQTSWLVEPLSEADCQVQSMADVSPTKWHLAHVTWFFETFLLERFEPDFKPCHPAFRVLFNSYYNGVGDKFPRAQRGLISRPGLAEVLAYRRQVDERVARLLERPVPPEALAILEIGLHHEQQHQELLLTDIKHVLSCNPLQPAYRSAWPLVAVAPQPLQWVEHAGGLQSIGHQGDGFAFDNESPRHSVWLQPFALASRLTTHGDWAAFIADGGYRDPRWWLAAGWDWIQSQRIVAPLYWQQAGASDTNPDWHSFTLHGRVRIDPHTPVAHLSYFEADAYARWSAANLPGHAGARLPTEVEWEVAAAGSVLAAGGSAAAGGAEARASGNLLEGGNFHPVPMAQNAPGLQQMFGDCWEWTSSSYAAYPGFVPWSGIAGEYNGKFMVNQYVLRGGSCVTPSSHIRASYRNFFPTEARWQFSGLRLARD